MSEWQTIVPAPTAKETPKNAGNMYDSEDLVFTPDGMPISVAAGTADMGSKTKSLSNAMSGVVSSPISASMGVAKQVAGIPQLLGKMVGSNKGDDAINAINQITNGANDQAGNFSYLTTKPSHLMGEIAPYVMGGAQGSVLEQGLMNTVGNAASKMTSKLDMLPSLLRRMGGQAAVGGATALGQAENTGMDLGDTLMDKVDNVRNSAMIGGAIPAVGAITKPIYEKGIKPAGKFVGDLAASGMGMLSGVGGEPIKTALKVGYEGGEKLKTFVDNMRELVPKKNIIADLESNIDVMKNQMQQRYRTGMADLSLDKTQLDYQPIRNAIRNATEEFGSYNGKEVNKSVLNAMNEVRTKVKEWQSEPAKIFHTPEGFDNLKQSVGEVLEKQEYGTKGYAAVKHVYDQIKGTIAKQAPKYAEVMKDYAESKDLLKEIKDTFSAGKSIDTQMRKLQSLMRNNVQTDYGGREELANTLIEKGGKDLMPAIAGQALSAKTPRGLAGKGLDIYAIAHALTDPVSSALMLGATNPRVVGESSVLLGKGAKKLADMTGGESSETTRNLAKLLLMKQGEKL